MKIFINFNSIEIFFYKLKNSSSELFLTSLIEKSLDNDWNSVVLFDSIERMEEINDLLWSYKETSFLPHGSENDENSKRERTRSKSRNRKR